MSEAAPQETKSHFGPIDAALVVAGSIIGAGIFFVSGSVAKSTSSTAEFFGVWILGGLIALAGALCNGELGGMFPRSGGEYVFLRSAYAPWVGFLSGWTGLVVAFPGSIATLASGLGRSIADLLGVPLSPWQNILGAVAVVLLTALNALGHRPGKLAQNVLSGTKIVLFVALIVFGFLKPCTVHAIPTGSGATGPLSGALLPVLFSYSGWNAAAYLTGEIRDPGKNLSKALVLGTLLSMALYLGLNAVYMRMVPLDEMRTTEGSVARVCLDRIFGRGMSAPFSALIAVSIASSLQASVMVGPRIYKAMAEDGLFFKAFGHEHARTGTPLAAVLTQGAIALALLAWGKFEELLNFTAFAIELFSALTVCAVIVLRVREPKRERPFRVPGYPVTPVLYVGVILWVLYTVLAHGMREAVYGLGMVLLGLPAYLWFSGARRTREVP
jgi:basic amino acid/polyamine antiporter, APA family